MKPHKERPPPTTPLTKLSKATQEFLQEHPPAITPSTLLATLPKRWSLYPPLVLLPESSFSTPEWKEYLSRLPDEFRNLFFAQIASSLNASHLALNAPIQSSILRSPRITPLYGDFGPLATKPPTPSDFENAFWPTVIQNGIKQIWAPMYTMFSRGNISEKTRVLSFPDLAGHEVADLYVGIGYFAFSYVKAGAKRVWGWDLNPWSVEGLRRGAKANGWACHVNPEAANETKIVVFNEDNLMASERLRSLGIKVKHVNLGLLPSSQASWKTATEILDEMGWIHVHGNCRDDLLDDWSISVVSEFEALFGGFWTIDIACKFRVKAFGPGVGHYVLDLACKKLIR